VINSASWSLGQPPRAVDVAVRRRRLTAERLLQGFPGRSAAVVRSAPLVSRRL